MENLKENSFASYRKNYDEYCLQLIVGILILLSLFVGAFANLEITFLVITAVLSVFLFLATKNNTIFIPKFLLILLVFQNFLIGVGAHLGKNESENLQYLTQVPTILIYILGIIYWLKNFKINFQNIIPALMILLLIGSFLVSTANTFSKVAYFRNFSCFLFVFIIGKNTIFDKSDKYEFARFMRNLGVFVVIVGIILMLLPLSVWSAIGVKEVYIAKANPELTGYVPNRFYTSVYKAEIYRMASLYYEPVNLSYFLAGCLIPSVSLFLSKKNVVNIVSIIILVLGILLTVGKGGFLLCMLSVLFLNFHYFFKLFNLDKKSIFTIVILLGITVLWLFSKYYYENIGAAAKPHFWAITNTFQNIFKNPLGVGLGNGGNLAYVGSAVYDSESDWLSSGGETGLLGMTYQLGIQYLLLVILFFAIISKKIYNSSINSNIEKTLLAYLPITLLLCFIFQENTFTPQCIVPFMLLLSSYSYKKSFEVEI